SRVLPFPRSMAVKAASFTTLVGLHECLKQTPPVLDFEHELVWPLAPSRVAGQPGVPRVLAFPKWGSGGTRLTPITRADALERLLHQCFNRAQHGGAAVASLVALAR